MRCVVSRVRPAYCAMSVSRNQSRAPFVCIGRSSRRIASPRCKVSIAHPPAASRGEDFVGDLGCRFRDGFGLYRVRNGFRKGVRDRVDDGGLQLLREKAESAGCDRSRPSRADGSDALCLSRRLLLQVSGRPLDEPRNLLRNALVTTGQIGNNDAQPFQLEGRSQQVRDGIGRHVSERSSADLLGDGVFEIGR